MDRSLSWLLTCVAISAVLFIPPAFAEGRRFAIRVDPNRAADVEIILADVALPIEIEVPKNQDTATLLLKKCGGSLPVRWDHYQEKGDNVLVTYTPCLKWKAPVTLTIQAGKPLETLVKPYGLHPKSAGELVKNPKKLKPGDQVNIDKVPDWTTFTTRPNWSTRAALVTTLAQRLGCGSESGEECLLRLGIYLIDRDTNETIRYTSEVSSAVAGSDHSRVLPQISRLTRSPADSLLVQALRNNRLPTPAPTEFRSEVAIVSEVGETSHRTTSDPEPQIVQAVAKNQWPYDLTRVQAMLKAAVSTPGLTRTRVGIAEGGLADNNGAPLERQIFATIERDINDQVDDDGNDVPDDQIGAGMWRDSSGNITADVALCGEYPPPNFSAWLGEPLLEASHGAVVTSLAAGRALLRAAPEIDKILPEVVFFRYLKNGCSPEQLQIDDQLAVIKAFEYLANEATIANFSLIVGSNNQPTFDILVRDNTTVGFMFLIVPAGNIDAGGGNLDDIELCPACLGNLEYNQRKSLDVSRNVIVVGAATPDLQRASYSAFGAKTVFLYAPGEPSGAVNLLGNDASKVEPATSWAAPYATLAVALMQALGINEPNPSKLRGRLQLASWPLLDASGNSDRSNARVLDLTKAAAIRHYAVEVLVIEEGRRVRKTYVGDLVTPLKDLAICSAQRLSASAYHAILFGPVVDGTREIKAYKRDLISNSEIKGYKTLPYFKVSTFLACEPSGRLIMKDLVEGVVEIPLNDITEILIPW
jgi:hypothetical protein